MRNGRIADAQALSVKIGKLISDTRAQHLSKVTHKDVKKLWSSVRSNTASRKRNCFSACTFTSEDLATHFATIATDVTYDETVINDIIMACHIVYGRPYCNDAKEGVGGITPPKLNRGG